MEYSIKASRFTCAAVPDKPAIQAELNRIYRLEKKLDIEKFIEKSVRKAKKTVFKKK
jgi:hypothetical protein